MSDNNRGVIVNRMGAFVAIPMAFVNDTRITNAGRCLYMLLSSYTSAKAEEPVAFPAYETIMERLNWGSKETVAAALLNLMQHGWIERMRRYSSSSVYTINYAPGEYRPEIELSPVVRKSNHQKSGNRTTDSPETERYLEVPKQKVLQPKAPPPNFDALAKSAKIDKDPSVRVAKAKARKIKANSQYDLGELEDAPAIRVHREVCGQQLITIEQAERIVSQVNGTAETTWRNRLRFWMGKGWRADTIDKHILFNETENKREEARGKKAAPMAADLYAELEKLVDAPLDAIPVK